MYSWDPAAMHLDGDIIPAVALKLDVFIISSIYEDMD